MKHTKKPLLFVFLVISLLAFSCSSENQDRFFPELTLGGPDTVDVHMYDHLSLIGALMTADTLIEGQPNVYYTFVEGVRTTNDIGRSSKKESEIRVFGETTERSKRFFSDSAYYKDGMRLQYELYRTVEKLMQEEDFKFFQHPLISQPWDDLGLRELRKRFLQQKISTEERAKRDSVKQWLRNINRSLDNDFLMRFQKVPTEKIGTTRIFVGGSHQRVLWLLRAAGKKVKVTYHLSTRDGLYRIYNPSKDTQSISNDAMGMVRSAMLEYLLFSDEEIATVEKPALGQPWPD